MTENIKKEWKKQCICATCKIKFIPKSHVAKLKYCSRKCMGKNKEFRDKLSKAKKGRPAWNKGIPAPWARFELLVTAESRRNMAESKRGKISPKKGLRQPEVTGEKNGNWRGDNVSYRSLHKWVERWLGKATKCMNNIDHKSTRFHWANKSKEYKRDLTDWTQLCPSCNCKDRIGRRVSP